MNKAMKVLGSIVSLLLLSAGPALAGYPASAQHVPHLGSGGTDSMVMTATSEAELKETCADAGLEGPEVLESNMTKPGSSAGLPQYVHGRFLYTLMPDACKDQFRRFAWYLVQIKDKSRNIWRNMTISGKKYWDSLQIDETGEYKDRYKEGKGQADFLLGPSGHGVSANSNSWFYNKNCRPVRTLIKTKVVKNEPRKAPIKGEPGLYRTVFPIVGQKIKRVAVKVLGKCAKKTT
jgi:hypothetical protein